MEAIQKKLWQWAIGFNYFNIMDALVTIVFTQHLQIHEAHPLMARLLAFSPLAFFAAKLGLGLYVTYRCFKRPETTWFGKKVSSANVLMGLTIGFALIVLWNVVNSYIKFLLYGIH